MYRGAVDRGRTSLPLDPPHTGPDRTGWRRAGALGLFRRDRVLAVGGYDPRMATEDIDLTWKLLLSGWQTAYEHSRQDPRRNRQRRRTSRSRQRRGSSVWRRGPRLSRRRREGAGGSPRPVDHRPVSHAAAWHCPAIRWQPVLRASGAVEDTHLPRRWEPGIRRFRGRHCDRRWCGGRRP
jgi:hypothetical protein